MREIKFRGKRLDNGEWVYGCYIFSSGQGLIHEVDSGRRVWTVKPETVGQFTGFLDKVGKEIYEGDVLQIVDIGESGVSKVFFEDGMWCVNYWESNASLHEFLTETRVYVIGDIFNNPNLLEDS